MLKKIAALLLCSLSFFHLTGCSAPAKAAVDSNKLQVIVSFNAMQEFVTAVGQEKVSVTTIIPDGVEPHDFAPKAQDLIALSKAQVFVYNGLGMESWVEDALQAAQNPNLTAINASEGADAITNADAAELQEHGQYDPHLWLSLTGAKLEVQNIANGLIQADPSNQAYYEQNCTAYLQQLDDLYNTYAQKLQSVSKKDFVTGHAAFAYLCRDFGLTQSSVEDVFAEGEPTAKQMTELIAYCKQQQITTIFSEKLASPAVSQTLAQEVGATVEPIYTMASNEEDKTYLARMRSNLEKIYQSLAADASSQ